MTVGIYGIFDSETDECLYVGLSKNIEQRRKSHLKLLRNKNHPRKDFVEWFQSNGAVEDLLDFRVLEECEYDEYIMNNLEIQWFNELLPKYYGKRPSLNELWKHSEETINKIKIARANQPLPENSRLNRDLVCINYDCGKIFHSKALSPKFCSKNCRIKHDIKRFDLKELADKYNSGMSLHDLAEEYSCSYRTIHKAMVKTNIPRRTIKESNILYSKNNPNAYKNRAVQKEQASVLCQYCFEYFKSSGIKRHETACKTAPRCLDCNKKVVKKSAKRCGKCYKEFSKLDK